MGARTSRKGNSAPSPEERRKLAAVEDALGSYSLESDSMRAALEALRELLGAEKVGTYGMRARDGADDLVVQRATFVGLPSASWVHEFDAFLAGRGVDWGGYHGLRPEPSQRNAVLGSDELARITRGRSRFIEDVLYRRIGLRAHDTLRVLVCDGPSLLAWVGVVQPPPIDERQRVLLEHLVPALHRRLAFERMVSEATLANATLVAVLEEIAGAAYVLDALGNVAHANGMARARLDTERRETLARLSECAKGQGDPSHVRVTPLRDGRGVRGYLVVEAPSTRRAQTGLVDAALRYGLTPAQTRVLERIALGRPNATIAAELGIAERTVEAHVTALFSKVQVSSRAALLVKLLGR